MGWRRVVVASMILDDGKFLVWDRYPPLFFGKGRYMVSTPWSRPVDLLLQVADHDRGRMGGRLAAMGKRLPQSGSQLPPALAKHRLLFLYAADRLRFRPPARFSLPTAFRPF